MSTRLLPQLSHHHDGHASTTSSGASSWHRPERRAAYVLGLWAYLKYTCRCAPPNTKRVNALVATLSFWVGLPLIVSFSGCARPALPQASTTGASHLFVWAGDADEDSGFLVVIDARRSEPTHGQVVATLPVGARATMPHHTDFPGGTSLETECAVPVVV